MIIVNENSKSSVKEKPYSAFGITAINSINKIDDKCTWVCHNNTNYCKENHVKFNKQFFFITDPIYFGLIFLMSSTGYYGIANIVFLVILIPLTIWFFLIKSINLQIEINKLKKENE
jgi:protein-S-isoprenylcysteine O-methyltransferase Ste14